jgi:hypothetical protein
MAAARAVPFASLIVESFQFSRPPSLVTGDIDIAGYIAGLVPTLIFNQINNLTEVTL